MNEQDVGITSAPAAVVGAVIDLASAALGAQAPAVEIVDVEQVIEALRAWRPACVEFAYLDGLALIQQGNWADAEFVFRSLVHESRCMPASQDMLLRCMRALGRVDWAHEAPVPPAHCSRTRNCNRRFARRGARAYSLRPSRRLH